MLSSIDFCCVSKDLVTSSYFVAKERKYVDESVTTVIVIHLFCYEIVSVRVEIGWIAEQHSRRYR